MQNPERRKRFFSLARICALALALILGGCVRWLVLPDDAVTAAAEREKARTLEEVTAAQTAEGADPAPAKRMAKARPRPSLAEVLDSPPWRRMVVLADFLDGADAGETMTLVQGLSFQATQAGSEMPLQQQQFMLAFIRWAQLDAQGLMAHAQKMPTITHYIGSVTLAYFAWAEVDWKSAYAAADRLQIGWYKWQALNVLGRTEPEKALRLAKAAGLTEHLSHVMNQTWGVLAKDNLERAVQLCFPPAGTESEVPNSNYRLRCLRQYAAKDFPAAMAVLDQFPADRGLRERLENECTSSAAEYANASPALAKSLADSLADGPVKTALNTALARAQVAADPEAALARAAASADPEAKRQAVADVFASLTGQDPARALALARDHPELDPSGSLYSEATTALSATDFSAALAAASALPQPEARDMAYANLARTWVSLHPDGTLAEMEQLFPNAAASPAVVGALVDQAAKKSPQAALDLAKSLPGDAGMSALNQLFQAHGYSSPGFVWQHLADLPQGPQRSDIIAQALSMPIDTSTGNKSAPAVLQRYQSLPLADQTPSAAVAATNTMYSCDSLAASEFVRDLPSGDMRDQSAHTLAYRLACDREPDFEAAMAWATSISSPQTRRSALQDLGSVWIEKNATAFQAALEAAPLTQQDKDETAAAFLLRRQAPSP